MTTCSAHDFASISDDILKHGLHVRFRAPGRSMLPLIHDGQVIRVSPSLLSSVRAGDIVLYRTRAGKLTAHRLLRKVHRGGSVYLLTKGDSSLGFDPLVHQDQLLGKVIAIEREGGQVVRLDAGFNLVRMRLYAALWLFAAALPPFVRGWTWLSCIVRYLRAAS